LFFPIILCHSYFLPFVLLAIPSTRSISVFSHFQTPLFSSHLWTGIYNLFLNIHWLHASGLMDPSSGLHVQLHHHTVCCSFECYESIFMLHIICRFVVRWSHPEGQPLDLWVWSCVAGPLAATVAARDHADTHRGAGGGAADAKPCPGGHLHGPEDRATDPNTRPLSWRSKLSCQRVK
jgi:hypothetical protein